MDEKQYLSVTALTKYIKYKFDNDVHLKNVLLKGEISNFKHHSRGHFYFTLKDDKAQIFLSDFVDCLKKYSVKFSNKEIDIGFTPFCIGILNKNTLIYKPANNKAEINTDDG